MSSSPIFYSAPTPLTSPPITFYQPPHPSSSLPADSQPPPPPEVPAVSAILSVGSSQDLLPQSAPPKYQMVDALPRAEEDKVDQTEVSLLLSADPPHRPEPEEERQLERQLERNLGGWPADLDVKMEPLDVETHIRLPIRRFEHEHRGYQEGSMSGLYELVLEFQVWSEEYNQCLMRKRDAEVAQKVEDVYVEESYQNKTRLSILGFMKKVRSAVSLLEQATPKHAETVDE